MKRSLWSCSFFVVLTVCGGQLMGGETVDPAAKPLVLPVGSGEGATAERKAKEQRLQAIQGEITALMKQEREFNDTVRAKYLSIESMKTNLNAQDQEYIALKQDLAAAEKRVAELRDQLRKKVDGMPEVQGAQAQMVAIKGQMQENKKKITELLKEKSRLSSELFAETQKDTPPVKAREVAPTAKPTAVSAP